MRSVSDFSKRGTTDFRRVSESRVMSVTHPSWPGGAAGGGRSRASASKFGRESIGFRGQDSN